MPKSNRRSTWRLCAPTAAAIEPRRIRVAKALHDAEGHGGEWPERPGDTGRRGNGVWVVILSPSEQGRYERLADAAIAAAFAWHPASSPPSDKRHILAYASGGCYVNYFDEQGVCRNRLRRPVDSARAWQDLPPTTP